jgi:pimeloyl-ACP methyl ester carboxylesterase
MSKTYVLVHGAWHGGWCWQRVSDALRAVGHRVVTPTCTGVGERHHLLSKEITLDIFIKDIVNVIEFEELSDVILVGHSFGGIVISGVADATPRKLRHLVYLDSAIALPGQNAFSVFPAEVVAARKKEAEDTSGGLSIPVPPLSNFGVTAERDFEWLKRRVTPHPLRTYTSPLNIKGPVGNNLPCTYVACTKPYYPYAEATRNWVKQQKGWKWLEIATGHDAMIASPHEVARLLMEVA